MKARNRSKRELQKIMKLKAKLFPEIKDLPSLRIEKSTGYLATYSAIDKTIICDVELTRKPFPIKEEVITHELCHYVIRSLHGGALISLFNELAAAKLHYERDPKSFKVWLKIGVGQLLVPGYLSPKSEFYREFCMVRELEMLEYISPRERSIMLGNILKKLEFSLLKKIGIPVKKTFVSYSFEKTLMEFYFTKKSDAEMFSRRIENSTIKKQEKAIFAEPLINNVPIFRYNVYENVWVVSFERIFPTDIKGLIEVGRKEYQDACNYNSFITCCIHLNDIISIAVRREERK